MLLLSVAIRQTKLMSFSCNLYFIALTMHDYRLADERSIQSGGIRGAARLPVNHPDAQQGLRLIRLGLPPYQEPAKGHHEQSQWQPQAGPRQLKSAIPSPLLPETDHMYCCALCHVFSAYNLAQIGPNTE